jgi:wyosine [tRNA(Phe)-imidazoG37] synthetase (radical SAM superfamily)
MVQGKLKYIYGPVYSWRVGMSLGIDPISTKSKICNFDCIYCQLGRTAKFYNRRENFVSVADILDEIKSLPPARVDYYTFSGRGEPTLAKNLGEMIRAVHGLTKGKTAVITNAALIGQREVQDDLAAADLVLAKLDACDQDSLHVVDIPAEDIQFSKIVEGIQSFRKRFSGKLALQIMFIEQNKKYAEAIAAIARTIRADEVQLNTPLRQGGAGPLSEKDLAAIKKYFKGMPAVTVYEAPHREVAPFDDKDTTRRHGHLKKAKVK